MANISQPFWDVAQDFSELPQGHVFIRHSPVFDFGSEPAIRYEGEEHSEWVKRPPNRLAIAHLSTNRCCEDGYSDVVYLKPEGDVGDLRMFQTLGHKIINHRPGWRGKEPVMNNLIDLPYYANWAKDIVNRYSKELSRVELVGGIVASIGRYDIDVNFYKALVELWCPETNTFHFLYGEVGISLWEINQLGGLPIIGDMYDEVVPHNEIICRRGGSKSFVLRNLFDIFQWLARRSADQEVFFEDWVDFFRKHRFGSRYGSTSDPPPKPVFNTDLAAFVALWICLFIMPSHRKVIRPGVFMMACNIAYGRKVAFAPAVLASLYMGLNAMVNHRKGPGFSTTVFPAHFLYAWAGCHFRRVLLERKIENNTLSIPGLLRVPKMLLYMNASPTPFNNPIGVRKFIRFETNFMWRPFLFMHHGGETVRDSRYPAGPEVLDSHTMEYVMCLRCGILPLRCAGDLFAEPYNPHRFGRQFGYDQHTPAYIDIPRRASSVRVLAGYWLHFSRKKTSSLFYIPEHDRSGRLILLYAQKRFRNVEAFFHQDYSLLIQDDLKDKRVTIRDWERGSSSKKPHFLDESIFISLGSSTSKRSYPVVDSFDSTKRQRTQGIRINDTLLENARVVQDPPTGPKIDDIFPSNLGMPQDSPTGPMNPPNIDIVVGEVDSNPVQGDMPIALEGGLPHNLPIGQEGAEDDDSTSSFGQIPSANFIRDAPSDMEELESDGANTHAESASATRQKEDAHTPTEELESDGSNADVEIANLPKQDKVAHKDNISSSSRQAVSGEIIKDAPSLVAELEGNDINIDTGLATSPKQDQGDGPLSSRQIPSKEIVEDTPVPVERLKGDSVDADAGPKQDQGPRNIPNVVLAWRDEIMSNIKSLNYHNYQNIINKVKESSSLFEALGIDLTSYEPFLEKIVRCATYAKEASEDPSIQVHIRNQQAKACVHEKTLALERLNKRRVDWANNMNTDKEEYQRLAERHHQLQTELCEISGAMKTLGEKIATSTNFFEASEHTQASLQVALDEAQAQLAEDQGDQLNTYLIDVFTRWLDELEEAKESLLKFAGH